MTMIAVTGGAGFIGSALIQELNVRGITDIRVVDDLDHPEKKNNLAPLQFTKQQGKDDFLADVRNGRCPAFKAILHMGACSSTTETDKEFLRTNNFEYTRHLAEFARKNNVRFIYASSAATYGDGSEGYCDDENSLESLQPLNPYGDSKHQFDLWAKANGALKEIIGLKYFNVYGPGEYHKEDMQSLVRKGYFQIQKTSRMKLFKSYRPPYGHGEQERDFLYIKDAVAMTLFFLDQPAIAGLYNIGSGVARNWNDLAAAIFRALGRPVQIDYIDMPASIRDQYQYHTRAEMSKLLRAGYSSTLSSLEEGITDYVQNYLVPEKRLGE